MCVIIALACLFQGALMVLKVTVWPYSFTPLATALAALVTQVYLGFR